MTNSFLFLLVTTVVALTARPAMADDGVTSDADWLHERGRLIFHDRFEREEEGNLSKAIGNGWNSATADRVPHIKMADLEGGVLKVASASKLAGHDAHIHHEAGFRNGGVIVRMKFPGLNDGEALKLGFVDRQFKSVHAGHLCYAKLTQRGVMLTDNKTGVMDLDIRARRRKHQEDGKPLPSDLAALLKTKQRFLRWEADTEWHEVVLVTQDDELRLSVDGQQIASHRSEGYAHPTKRWFSFLIPNTVWIDDVQIWKVD